MSQEFSSQVEGMLMPPTRNPPDDDLESPFVRRERRELADGERMVRVEERLEHLGREVRTGFTTLKEKVDHLDSRFKDYAVLSERVTQNTERINYLQKTVYGAIAAFVTVMIGIIVFSINNGGTGLP